MALRCGRPSRRARLRATARRVSCCILRNPATCTAASSASCPPPACPRAARRRRASRRPTGAAAQRPRRAPSLRGRRDRRRRTCGSGRRGARRCCAGRPAGRPRPATRGTRLTPNDVMCSTPCSPAAISSRGVEHFEVRGARNPVRLADVDHRPGAADRQAEVDLQRRRALRRRSSRQAVAPPRRRGRRPRRRDRRGCSPSMCGPVVKMRGPGSPSAAIILRSSTNFSFHCPGSRNAVTP